MKTSLQTAISSYIIYLLTLWLWPRIQKGLALASNILDLGPGIGLEDVVLKHIEVPKLFHPVHIGGVWFWGLGALASTGVRAYNGGLGARPLAMARGRTLSQRVRDKVPLKLSNFLAFWPQSKAKICPFQLFHSYFSSDPMGSRISSVQVRYIHCVCV